MDKYTKIKKIGEGSFGKAILVRHKESGKQMVVKEINMGRMSRKEREEARKETAVLAQLAHPNIVTYRESFEEIGNLYIVMDYCDGGDLYAKINSQRGVLLREDEILDWFVQTCLAIKHIHDRKILHRDIKSQNIFLTRHGIVKLGDFGIAKVLNSTVELARTCIGTPYYLSPEICENKPYNNKSDIWSLGCVLYELTTLKHAFEAGNMKNLVLKIIRGSYPPPPPRYSYELRSLINALFKRTVRERPSINSVLKKPLLQTRIKRFLSDSEVADEFSHTVMHGIKIQKALPVGGRPLPPKPVVAKKTPAPSQARYNPASVYAPSVARKSRENRRSADQAVRKSGGSGARKPAPSVQVHQNDLVRRRNELLERERKRRDELKKKQDYAKQHKDLVDRQRMNRMNQAREEGWKNLIDSLSSTDDSEATLSPRVDAVKKPANPSESPAERYEHYHDWLNKAEADRKAGGNGRIQAPAKPKTPAATPMVGVAGALGWVAAPTPAPAPAQQAAMAGQMAGVKASEAAEKARLIEEYHARKKAAAVHRARGGGVGVGAAISPRIPPPKPSSGTPKPSAAPKPRREARPESARPTSVQRRVAVPARPYSAREQKAKQEEEYLSRLRQIRLQNFNERKSRDKAPESRYKIPKQGELRNEADMRRKKIEALKAQADERARKLKEDLERKRRDAVGDHKKQPQVKAAPAPRMTEAMKAIGVVKESPPPSPDQCAVGMTAAMAAIGAKKSPLQAKKEEILKRLNSRPPTPEKPKAPEKTEKVEKPEKPEKPERPERRSKWGEPVMPPVPERPKWGAEGSVPNVLSQLSLEETGSQMEATSAQDGAADPSSARKHWGAPAGTVVNVLRHAQLDDTGSSVQSDPDSTSTTAESAPTSKATTITLEPSAPTSKATTITLEPSAPTSKAATITLEPSAPTSKAATVILDPLVSVVAAAAPAIGSTITIQHNGKSTVVISKVPDKSVEDKNVTDELSTKPEKPQVPKKPTIPTKPVICDKPANTDLPMDLEALKPQDDEEKENEEKIASKKTQPTTSVVASVIVEEAMFEKVEHDEGEVRKEEHDMVVEELDEDDVLEEQKEGNEEVKEDEKKTVENEEEDEEDEKGNDDEVDQLKPPATSKLMLGLTTGHFDADVSMLRTCSEPDLSKLFRTDLLQNPFYDNFSEVPDEDDEDDSADSLDIDALCAQLDAIDQEEQDDQGLQGDDDGKDEEDDVTSSSEDKIPSFQVDTPEGEDDEEEEKDSSEKSSANSEKSKDEIGSSNEEDDDDGGGDDDDDLETLRESMMSILQQDDPASDEELSITQRKKKTKKTTKKGKKKKKRTEESSVHAAQRQWSDGSVEDLRTMRETMKTLLQPVAAKENLQPVTEGGPGGDASVLNTFSDNTEAWQDDEDGDDDFFEEEDMFSRIEETRAKLEQELGCDTFLKAYKTVQAIHEDEDEKMEEGVHLVTQILGSGKVHLYPSILQLVMSDGAFTEDND